MIQATNFSALKGCVNPKEGDIGFTLDDNQYYAYINGAWQQREFKAGSTTFSVPMKELTMQLYAQLPRQEIKNNHDIIELINKEGQYFMLLNNDIRYFTLFHIDIAANEDFTSVLDEIINDFGEPRNIAVEKDGSITIWVYGKDGKVIDFHLFKYDNGVIEVTRI